MKEINLNSKNLMLFNILDILFIMLKNHYSDKQLTIELNATVKVVMKIKNTE